MEHDEAWRLTDRLQTEQGKGDPFAAAIRGTRMAMIITNPRQRDNPIVFVNESFLKLTGYTRDEIMGKNCRFLQGAGTNRADVKRIGEAIKSRTDIAVDLLNYRKDGTPFWNALYISPVTNVHGELLYYFASQIDVTDRVEAVDVAREAAAKLEVDVAARTLELSEALAKQTMLTHEVDHRVKNNLMMIASMFTMRIRAMSDGDCKNTMAAMRERVHALGMMHKRLYQSGDSSRFDATSFTMELVTELMEAAGRDDIKLKFTIEPLQLDVAKSSSVALILNELVTNALKHAFNNGRVGTLTVSIEKYHGSVILAVADNGPGVTRNTTSLAESFGRRLIETLARGLFGSIEWKPNEGGGTMAVLTFPLEVPK